MPEGGAAPIIRQAAKKAGEMERIRFLPHKHAAGHARLHGFGENGNQPELKQSAPVAIKAIERKEEVRL